MLGRMKGAVADAAETLRRAFAGLKVYEVAPQGFVPRGHGWRPPSAEGYPGLLPPVTEARGLPLLMESVQGRTVEPFQAKRVSEAGWARWGAEAEVVRMVPLETAQASPLAIPPFPPVTVASAKVNGFPQPFVRRHAEPLRSPGRRILALSLGPVAAYPGLPTLLSLPVPIQGELIHRLPKGLWMRYTLELVRSTGENVRNLEVLGLFLIPQKGVTDLQHDPKASRLLIRLEASALKARRSPFILARRKDDGSLLSCFLEEP